MQILRMGRRCGKTTQLVKQASEGGLYIICANKERAYHIMQVAEELGVNILFPITVGEIADSRGIKSMYIDKVLVDDVEDVLRAFIGKTVLLATTSCDVIVKVKVD